MQGQILMLILKQLDKYVPANMKTIYWSILMIVVGLVMVLFGDSASFDAGVVMLGFGVQGIFQRHAVMKLENSMNDALTKGVPIIASHQVTDGSA